MKKIIEVSLEPYDTIFFGDREIYRDDKNAALAREIRGHLSGLRGEGVLVYMSQKEWEQAKQAPQVQNKNNGNEKAYLLAVRSAHELLTNVGNPPVRKDDRACVITQLEKVLFKGETIPLEFRTISDTYIANGPSALSG